mgnify:CR=1 FL=1|jgi:hypothetical protein
METRNQTLIRNILGDDAQATDNSLQGKAFGRAISNAIPKTMTPWEWEEWYAVHGKPDHFTTRDESTS